MAFWEYNKNHRIPILFFRFFEVWEAPDRGFGVHLDDLWCHSGDGRKGPFWGSPGWHQELRHQGQLVVSSLHWDVLTTDRCGHNTRLETRDWGLRDSRTLMDWRLKDSRNQLEEPSTLNCKGMPRSLGPLTGPTFLLQ